MTEVIESGAPHAAPVRVNRNEAHVEIKFDDSHYDTVFGCINTRHQNAKYHCQSVMSVVSKHNKT